jgi:hypothetical protein
VNASNGYGVWGYNADTTGGYGVYGQGYYGARTYSPYYVGAYGRSDSSSGFGLAGHNYWGGVGVGAWSYSGRIFQGNSGDFPGGTVRFYVSNTGGVYADEGFYIFLSPPGDDPNTPPPVLITSQSPEAWVEDLGTATLVDGRAVVTIRPDFASTVNLNVDYHVFLTPLGDCRGLYVARKTPTSFEVRELGGGRSDIAFDYRIVAKRQGYEALRMQAVPESVPLDKKEQAPDDHLPLGVTTAASMDLPALAPVTATVQQARLVPAQAVELPPLEQDKR